MSRRVRIGIVVTLIGLGLVAVGVFVVSFLLRQTLAPPPVPTLPPPATENVVVTTHDMALGTLLREEDVMEVEVPVELVPRNAITNAELIVGRITKIPLVQGEMVMDHHLADPTNIHGDLAYILNENAVLMAFQPNDLMSSLNVIQRGDIVNVLVTIDAEIASQAAFAAEEETQAETFTFDAFQLLEITALVVDIEEGQAQQQSRTTITASDIGQEEEVQPTPTPVPRNVRLRSYLLAINPQDALVLKHLQDTGAEFDLVVRNPASTQLFDLEPVTGQFLIDRYQLELEPSP